MELYTILLFLHVLGALGLAMSLGIEWTCIFQARRAKTVEQASAWLGVSGRLPPLFGVSSLAIFVPGRIMVFMQWGWGTGWIDLALVAAILLGVLGPAVNGRRGAAILKGLEGAGNDPVTPQLRRQLRDPVLWTSVNAMIGAVLGIVFLMTVKPGFAGSAIALLVAIALGFVVASRGWDRTAGESVPEMSPR